MGRFKLLYYLIYDKIILIKLNLKDKTVVKMIIHFV